jgi:hypothetical protein
VCFTTKAKMAAYFGWEPGRTDQRSLRPPYRSRRFGNSSNHASTTYPIASFTNLHGVWRVEASPTLGYLRWDSDPELFRTPDGALHVFAYLNTTWSGTDLGDQLHHFVRPCLEVLAD